MLACSELSVLVQGSVARPPGPDDLNVSTRRPPQLLCDRWHLRAEKFNNLSLDPPGLEIHLIGREGLWELHKAQNSDELRKSALTAAPVLFEPHALLGPLNIAKLFIPFKGRRA